MNTEEEQLSFSQINQWLGCQKQYWFQRVEELEPMDVGAGLVVGTAYHTAVEMYFRAKMHQEVPISLEEILDVFEHVILEEESTKVINWGRSSRYDEVKKATGVLQAFLEVQETNENEVVAVEEMFRLDLPELPPVIGRVDLIERAKSGSLVIVDFKSSATKPSSSSDPHVLGDVDSSHQMTLYQMWAKQKYPDQQVNLRMDYLVKSARNPLYLQLSTQRLQEQEAALLGLLQDVWEQISMAKAGVIHALPIRSFRCTGCGFRQTC